MYWGNVYWENVGELKMCDMYYMTIYYICYVLIGVRVHILIVN